MMSVARSSSVLIDPSMHDSCNPNKTHSKPSCGDGCCSHQTQTLSAQPPDGICNPTVEHRREQFHTTSCQRKHAYILSVFIFFFLNICISTGIILLMLKFSDFLNQKECIPCEHFDNKLPLEYDVCCREPTSIHMRSLFKEKVKSEVKVLLKETLVNSINKQAAHVFLREKTKSRTAKTPTSRSLNSQEHEYSVIKNWSQQGTSAFIRDDIDYNNSTGKFKIKVPGVYVVYSRLVFDPPTTPSARGNSILFGQAIKQMDKQMDVEQILLEDFQMRICDSSSIDIPCQSSFVYSTLFLRRDLELTVMAKPANLLRSSGQASYFGLYKID